MKKVINLIRVMQLGEVFRFGSNGMFRGLKNGRRGIEAVKCSPLSQDLKISQVSR